MRTNLEKSLLLDRVKLSMPHHVPNRCSLRVRLLAVVVLTVGLFGLALAQRFADLDGDGRVDAADLSILISQWRGTGSADLNGDGVVNTADAGMLFSSWGTAPPLNIVIILTDDQRYDTLQHMPKTQSLLGNAGVVFTNAVASTPQCCPNRATLLTGLYAHNTGVLGNALPNGGATVFTDTTTIATVLRSRGYRTGFFGKYLNGYSLKTPWPYVPPGWDDWHAFQNPEYYNYNLVENGALTSYGSNPQDYSTDVLSAKAVEFIRGTSSARPFLLYFAPYAPHGPATPAPGDIGSFGTFPPWRPPSYNEADVSDKPEWVRLLPAISSTSQEAADAFYQKQLESLQAVDRSVEAIVHELSRTGRLGNTAIIYTSDNGLSWGEHRWLTRKRCVYEECIKVPMIIRAPGIPARTEARLVSSVDIAPTIYSWARTSPPQTLDGQSLVPLLSNPAASWRTEVLLEFLAEHIPITVPERYQAVRTERYVYAEYVNGDREFYDLQTDPYQLINSINNPAYTAVIADLGARLNALRGTRPVIQRSYTPTPAVPDAEGD